MQITDHHAVLVLRPDERPEAIRTCDVTEYLFATFPDGFDMVAGSAYGLPDRIEVYVGGESLFEHALNGSATAALRLAGMNDEVLLHGTVVITGPTDDGSEDPQRCGCLNPDEVARLAWLAGVACDPTLWQVVEATCACGDGIVCNWLGANRWASLHHLRHGGVVIAPVEPVAS